MNGKQDLPQNLDIYVLYELLDHGVISLYLKKSHTVTGVKGKEA